MSGTNVPRFSASAKKFRHPGDARSWFIAPVYVGDVVSFYARVLREGRTSVTVQVTVEKQRTPAMVKVTEAEVVYVAIDENGTVTSLR